MKTEYKETNKEIPYPRNEWICDCGFKYVLMVGFNPDWKSNDYGKTIIPSGKCMKCKKEIFVDEKKIKDTRSFKQY